MANNYYKKATTITLKVSGVLDAKNSSIYIDDVPRTIGSLMADFDGADIELVVKSKHEEEFDMPEEPAEE